MDPYDPHTNWTTPRRFYQGYPPRLPRQPGFFGCLQFLVLVTLAVCGLFVLWPYIQPLFGNIREALQSPPEEYLPNEVFKAVVWILSLGCFFALAVAVIRFVSRR